jgi:hypothetical protein
MALSRAALLALYRDVLRAAARFPSKKRDAIIADIKLEFREARGHPRPRARCNLTAWRLGQGAVETDSAQVQRRVALAHDSLTRLRQYAGAWACTRTRSRGRLLRRCEPRRQTGCVHTQALMSRRVCRPGQGVSQLGRVAGRPQELMRLPVAGFTMMRRLDTHTASWRALGVEHHRKRVFRHSLQALSLAWLV